MFGWFKKKEKQPEKKVLQDLDHNQILPGDEVESLRYELGRSKVIETPEGIYYESLSSKKRIHWTKMIDASTELQKVKKIES